MKNFGIKEGYFDRKNNDYYEDYTGTTTWQPDVYTAVVELARRCDADTIIDIGSGNGQKLIPYKDEFKFIFVDFGSNLQVIEKNIGKKGNKYIDQDFEKGFPNFSAATLKKSVVVCSDVIEHMVKPDILAKNLVKLSKGAPFVVISTPDRLRTRGVSHYGPPQNQTHVREWSMEELDAYLRSLGMKHNVTGITRSNDYEQVRRTIAIVAGTYLSDLVKKPSKNITLSADYAEQADFANTYYGEQYISLTNGSKADISLASNEWLAPPNPTITVGSLIQDAKNKGYGAVNAQVIDVDPDKSYSWPQAGIVRQGHGLIGQQGPVRGLQIGKGTKVYPLQLIIFRQIEPKRFKPVKTALRSKRLIDTGHLIDDFVLETMVGWEILNH